MEQAQIQPDRANDELQLNWLTLKLVLRERGFIGVYDLLCITAYGVAAGMDNVVEYCYDQCKLALVHSLLFLHINMTQSALYQSIGLGHGIGHYPYSRVAQADIELTSLDGQGYVYNKHNHLDSSTDEEDVRQPLQYSTHTVTPKKLRPNIHLPPIIAPPDMKMQMLSVNRSYTGDKQSGGGDIMKAALYHDDAQELMLVQPPLCSVSAWKLVYSLADGANISTLYNRINGLTSCLLIIRTRDNSLIGAYLHKNIAVYSPPRFDGSPKSFLFTFTENGLETYRYSKKNTFYLRATDSSLSIGGNSTALWINDSQTEGVTLDSETYNSPPLCEQRFTIQMIEIWTFQSPV